MVRCEDFAFCKRLLKKPIVKPGSWEKFFRSLFRQDVTFLQGTSQIFCPEESNDVAV